MGILEHLVDVYNANREQFRSGHEFVWRFGPQAKRNMQKLQVCNGGYYLTDNIFQLLGIPIQVSPDIPDNEIHLCSIVDGKKQIVKIVKVNNGISV